MTQPRESKMKILENPVEDSEQANAAGRGRTEAIARRIAALKAQEASV